MWAVKRCDNCGRDVDWNICTGCGEPITGPSGLVSADHYNDGSSKTSGVKEAIDALPSTGGEVILPPGYVDFDESVTLRSNLKLTGAGKELTIIRPTSSFVWPPVMNFFKTTIGMEYIELSDFSINGGARGGIVGIALDDSKYIHIHDLKIHDLESIAIQASSGEGYGSDVLIANCDFDDVGTVGTLLAVEMNTHPRSIIKECLFTNVKTAVGMWSDYLTVVDCVIVSPENEGLHATGGSNMSALRNRITDGSRAGILVGAVGNIIEANMIIGCARDGIEVRGGQWCSIRGNMIGDCGDGTPTYGGIKLKTFMVGTRSCLVEDNLIYNYLTSNCKYGIKINEATDILNKILGNVCSNIPEADAYIDNGVGTNLAHNQAGTFEI